MGDREGASARSVEFDLVDRARTGDRRAFEELVRLHADRLFAVVVRLVGDRQDAEAAVQESFLRAWRSLQRFEGRSQFYTWLYRIGVIEARRVQARRAIRPAPAALDEAPGEVADRRSEPYARAEAHDLRRTLEAAIARLPIEYRTPLVLRDVEGLSTAEAAAVMELGEAAFKSRLHRARLSVRAAVEEFLDREDGS